MANTNADFLIDLEKNYPDMDWDAFDIEKCPDVWKISGMQHRRMIHKKRVYEDKTGFEIAKEYTSYEDAVAALEEMKSSAQWAKGVPLGTYGPVDWETVKITKTKSDEHVDLEIMQILRKDVLDGKKVFPLLLP